ncbi:hypothetical protein GDR29_07835 [Xanthomonas oryzae pv. oryzae]|nr:hypothetical protein GDR29_07835 [Xanthomonas oryzae pv. oryzae]
MTKVTAIATASPTLRVNREYMHHKKTVLIIKISGDLSNNLKLTHRDRSSANESSLQNPATRHEHRVAGAPIPTWSISI